MFYTFKITCYLFEAIQVKYFTHSDIYSLIFYIRAISEFNWKKRQNNEFLRTLHILRISAKKYCRVCFNKITNTSRYTLIFSVNYFKMLKFTFSRNVAMDIHGHKNQYLNIYMCYI